MSLAPSTRKESFTSMVYLTKTARLRLGLNLNSPASIGGSRTQVSQRSIRARPSASGGRAESAPRVSSGVSQRSIRARSSASGGRAGSAPRVSSGSSPYAVSMDLEKPSVLPIKANIPRPTKPVSTINLRYINYLLHAYILL